MKVKVGIPVYNGEKYIEKAIYSVLRQTFTDFDLYVYDNCSTDNTENILKEMTNIPNFHYIRHENNIGAAPNWDCCLETTDEDYVAMLHADDMWAKSHLECAIESLEKHKNCILYYSPCYWVDENDNIIQLTDHNGHLKTNYWGGRNELAELMVYDMYLTMSSVVFRSDIIKKAGKFSKVKSTDWEYITRIADINDNFYFDKTPTTLYRWHQDQQSNDYYKTNDPLTAHVSLLNDLLSFTDIEKFKGYEHRIWNLLVNRINQYPEGAVGSEMLVNDIGKKLQRLVEQE